MNIIQLCLLLAAVLIGFSSSSVWGKSSHTQGKQKWGYVEVRPGAFMFYWLYYTTGAEDYTQKPWVVFLEGGPGISASGVTNFESIGPLEVSLEKRNLTWVNEANVLFIDSPVGTGFSYVDNTNLLTTDNTQIVSDLLITITKFLQAVPAFQTIPLYIFGHSYGGKVAPELARKLQSKIKYGIIKCDLKGVTIGDAIISSLDHALTWSRYLYATSLLDTPGRDKVNASAYKIKEPMDTQQYQTAYDRWTTTLDLIQSLTNGVDMENILAPNTPPPMSARGTVYTAGKYQLMQIEAKKLKKAKTDEISELMNGHIREMLSIIPDRVIWISENPEVYAALTGNFMKPGVKEVENLLKHTDLTVNVYNGQLDAITNIIGTSQWVDRLNWSDLEKWKNAERYPISLNNQTAMFVKTYKQFGFYWVLKAGHYAIRDQQVGALRMLQQIINTAE